MDYASLTALLEDTVENTFTAEQHAFFFQQAEQRIYQAVRLPALRSTSSGSVSSGVSTYALPDDFLYVHSLAVVNPDGSYAFLLDKDVEYIREAYPSAAAFGTPRHYAVLDETTLLLGPTPNATVSLEIQYGRYPESVVVAGTTWLSENYSPVLINGALVEAARFLKLEQDMVVLYGKMYLDALEQLKMFGEGKLRQDTYRNAQVRVSVQ